MCACPPHADRETQGGRALNRQEKAAEITALADRLRTASAVIATDMHGLTVRESSNLRGRLRAADAELTVVKNTLARRAANETGHDALLPMLVGPSALVWVSGDPARAAKVVVDVSRETAERLAPKGGLLDGSPIDTAQVRRLAALPSREQLLAQLAGGLQAPVASLAYGLGSLIPGLARALAAYRDQRDAGTAATS